MLGRRAPRKPESLSGFSSSKSRRARGRRPAAPRHAEEPGAQRRPAGGGRRRDPRRLTRPPPWPRTRRLLRAAPRPLQTCGRTDALPPPGMLHGASAAFPGRRAADTRPRPGREGGGRGEGGREGASAEVSAPAGCASAPAGSAPAPAPLSPSLSGCAAVPQALSPGPPTRADRTAKHAHPRTWPAGLGSPRTRFLFGTHNRCLGNKAADRGHRRAQPPAEGLAALPSEGVAEIRVGNTFQPRLRYGRTPVTPWQRGAGRARGSAPRAPLRGPATPAGGPAQRGLTAWMPARLRARLPRGGQRTGPVVPPFRPPEPACESAAALRVRHRPSPLRALPSLLRHLPLL